MHRNLLIKCRSICAERYKKDEYVISAYNIFDAQVNDEQKWKEWCNSEDYEFFAGFQNEGY